MGDQLPDAIPQSRAPNVWPPSPQRPTRTPQSFLLEGIAVTHAGDRLTIDAIRSRRILIALAIAFALTLLIPNILIIIFDIRMMRLFGGALDPRLLKSFFQTMGMQLVVITFALSMLWLEYTGVRSRCLFMFDRDADQFMGGGRLLCPMTRLSHLQVRRRFALVATWYQLRIHSLDEMPGPYFWDPFKNRTFERFTRYIGFCYSRANAEQIAQELADFAGVEVKYMG